MALHSLYCAEVPLRNCSLAHSLVSSYVRGWLSPGGEYVWLPSRGKGGWEGGRSALQSCIACRCPFDTVSRRTVWRHVLLVVSQARNRPVSHALVNPMCSSWHVLNTGQRTLWTWRRLAWQTYAWGWYKICACFLKIRNWSHIATHLDLQLDLVLLLLLFFFFLVFFLLGWPLQNKSKAPSFQIDQGWNLAGLVFKQILIDWRSRVFGTMSNVQDGSHDVISHSKILSFGERSLIQLPARALSNQLRQLSLPSLRGS